MLKTYPPTDFWGGGVQRTLSFVTFIRNQSHTRKFYHMVVNNVDCTPNVVEIEADRAATIVFKCTVDVPAPDPNSLYTVFPINIAIAECYDQALTRCRPHLGYMYSRVWNPDLFELKSTVSWDVDWADGIATAGTTACVNARAVPSQTRKGGGAVFSASPLITPTPPPQEDQRLISATYVVVAKFVNTTYQANIGLRYAILMDLLSAKYAVIYFIDNLQHEIVLPVRYLPEQDKHRLRLKAIIWGSTLNSPSSACVTGTQVYAHYVYA